MSNFDRDSRHDHVATPWPVLGGMLLVAGIIGGVLWGLGVFPFGNRSAPNNPNAKQREPAARTELSGIELERINLNKATKPSVVNVDTLAYAQRGDFSTVERNLGTGTGFFWDDDGRIVTNFHVVRDALAMSSDRQVIVHPDRKIMVTLANGEAFPAGLVGIAPDNDLAVIKLSKLPLNGVKEIKVGTSADLEVGQSVYAIGSPFGQQFTFVHGIISALGRSIQSPSQRLISDVIQTDAPLNPGNSGGPLLDRDGRLIGVVTAITSPNGGSVGIGYAIPVDTVNKVVTEIIRHGRVAQPYIGADFVLEEWAVRRAGILKGVVISGVAPRSPAAVAGLQPGDIILKINDTEIVNLADLEQVLNRVKVGERLNLTIRRRNQQMQVAVQVEGI